LVSATPSHHHHNHNLPCCEIGVGVRFGIDCGPVTCGLGIIKP
jgi:hypothetical protein